MARRSSNLPLLLGALLSLVVHLGAIPAFSLLKLAAPPQTTTPEEPAKATAEENAHVAQAVQEPKPAGSPEEKPSKPTEAPRERAAPKAIAAPTAPRPAARPREMIDPEKPRPTGKAAAPEPDENEVKLGRDNGLPITTVAWIAYDDFQTLIARKARTEQPALQKNANPVPVGGIEFDAADAPSPEKRGAPNDAGGGGALKVEGDGKPRSVASGDATARPATPPAAKPALTPPPAPPTPPEPPSPTPVVVKPELPRVAAATPPRVEPAPVPQPEVKPAPPPEPVMPRPSPAQLAAAIPRPPATPTIEVPKPPAPATPQPANPAPQPTPKPSQPSAPTASPQQPVTPSAPTPVPGPLGPPGAPGANPAASAEGVSKPVMPDAPRPAATDGKGLGADAKSEPGTPNGPPGGGGSGAGNKNTDLPPTAAPRSDRESPPSSLTDGGAKLRPGAVLTGDGIEIKTAVPRLSAVAQASVIPSNPQVKVVFDKSGNVIDAAVLTSSGSANFDGPILASLYKWKAAGRKLQEVQGNLTLKITIILVD